MRVSKILIIMTVVLSLLIGLAPAISADEYYREITITNPDSTTYSNQLVAIYFNSTDLLERNLVSSGDKDGFKFTDDEGNTLDYYIYEESWDSGDEHTLAWVEVPEIEDDSDTNIYLHYGNTSEWVYESTTDVWTYYEDFSGGMGGWIQDHAPGWYGHVKVVEEDGENLLAIKSDHDSEWARATLDEDLTDTYGITDNLMVFARVHTEKPAHWGEIGFDDDGSYYTGNNMYTGDDTNAYDFGSENDELKVAYWSGGLVTTSDTWTMGGSLNEGSYYAVRTDWSEDEMRGYYIGYGEMRNVKVLDENINYDDNRDYLTLASAGISGSYTEYRWEKIMFAPTTKSELSVSEGEEEASEPIWVTSNYDINETSGIIPFTIEMSVDIKNEGIESDYTADFKKKTDEESYELDSETKTISMDETKTFTFTHELTEAGSYEFEINDLGDKEVQAYEGADIYISDFNVSPTEGTANFTTSTEVDVTNDGDVSDDKTIDYYIDDSLTDSETVTVDAGETETIWFNTTWNEDDEGEHNISCDGYNQNIIVNTGFEVTAAIKLLGSYDNRLSEHELENNFFMTNTETELTVKEKTYSPTTEKYYISYQTNSTKEELDDSTTETYFQTYDAQTNELRNISSTLNPEWEASENIIINTTIKSDKQLIGSWEWPEEAFLFNRLIIIHNEDTDNTYSINPQYNTELNDSKLISTYSGNNVIELWRTYIETTPMLTKTKSISDTEQLINYNWFEDYHTNYTAIRAYTYEEDELINARTYVDEHENESIIDDTNPLIPHEKDVYTGEENTMYYYVHDDDLETFKEIEGTNGSYGYYTFNYKEDEDIITTTPEEPSPEESGIRKAEALLFDYGFIFLVVGLWVASSMTKDLRSITGSIIGISFVAIFTAVKLIDITLGTVVIIAFALIISREMGWLDKLQYFVEQKRGGKNE